MTEESEKYEAMCLWRRTFDAELQFIVDKKRKLCLPHIDIPLTKSPENKMSMLCTTDDGDPYNPCAVLFPMILNKLRTGSRSEYLFTEKSDYDDIYEVGPIYLTSKQQQQQQIPVSYTHLTLPTILLV